MHKDIMAKHIERVAIITNLTTGIITQKVAALQLNLSTRQIRRMKKKYTSEGAIGLLHQNQGRPNSQKKSPEIENQVINWIKENGADFGATFAQEKIKEYLKIDLSVGTIRTWLIRHKMLHIRRKPNRQQFERRQRKAYFGLMLQVDGSRHDWFEGRAEWCTLLTCIDDATGKILARFATGETSKDLMILFKDYISLYGRPHSVYSDHGGAYKVNTGNAEGYKKTQLGRALDELGIELIFANSPQAKGRVERNHGTHQDRLVKEMRLRGISSIGEANHYLNEEYIQKFNQQFSVKPAKSEDVHRSIKGFNIDKIFTIQEERVVQNDGIVQYKNMIFQITKNRIFVKSKTKILICEHLDGQTTLWIDAINLGYKKISQRPIAIKIEKTRTTNPPKKPSPASLLWNNR